MTRLTDVWRSHLLSTLSGNSEGRPAWVDRLEEGTDAGFFGPGSASWIVHGELPTLVAGIRSLLMQALHPGALAGVHDWSRYRDDPLGRLTGTIQWLMTVTFADTATAERESERVRRFHTRVTGTYVDAAGRTREYSAGDPELLSWVHNVFTDSFLSCQELWGSRIPGGADTYVHEWTRAGTLIGVGAPPRSAAELRAQLHAVLAAGTLKSDDRVREIVSFIRTPPLSPAVMPAYRLLFAGAVASIPREYRELLGLRRPLFPAVTTTRIVLGLVRRILGRSSTSEEAALRRIARIRASV
ncbi:uncharacterized protein (DUF2236 family) [Okibacterium sp. HSC-33S16]|uniref:oxygenase MpaB family protein n=1 Tax=Okibacterium sp. HSC-33S16 TaxID=2910965 RepID=UPI0020A21237|nr:oxygenase MpaB family protein [Okibacterium sp. HSC-33S16]MCP2031755.1 uncharacterized protein (DUF2236 family) [Okibacterium sp. HSC-33S16]